MTDTIAFVFLCTYYVSKNNYSVQKQLSITVQALYNHKGEGYEMLNRWVLSRDRKTPTEGAEVPSSGRLFQT